MQTDHVDVDDISHEDLAGMALERSQLYGLLARIFREEPDVTLLCQLKTREFTLALSDAGLDLGSVFRNKPDKLLQEELTIEFTRLFYGPGHHISPHESVQLKRGSGTLWGEETIAVKRNIEAAGFDFEDEFNGIPDHISVELEFLAKLTVMEADAWRRADSVAAGNALQWQHDFISKHAGKWMPGFCRKVNEGARLPFYAVFASLLRQLLAGEKANTKMIMEHAFLSNKETEHK